MPCLSDLSTGECTAYGLSVRMGMYIPDDVLCAATEKANKAKEGERDAPILDDGRAHDGLLRAAHRA